MRKATYILRLHPDVARLAVGAQVYLDQMARCWRDGSEWYHLWNFEDVADDIRVQTHVPKMKRASAVVAALVQWLDTPKRGG